MGKRFPILKHMRSFSLETQRDIAIALPILFNIIRSSFSDDSFADAPEQNDPPRFDRNDQSDRGGEDWVQSEGWRDRIAAAMWDDYQSVLRRRGR
ncbi:hypothetical protein BJ741DRAFT_638922 [Chytriomyces cf. hyalinus JEL632]|nr:hypothetical protein BJ741DRAFT_638922 [Chytriomyces cf. hyalinus JEL632]